MSDKARVLVFAGTRKGAFVFESDTRRENWKVNGPHFAGWSLQHMKYDPRSGILYASLDHMVYGSNIHMSPDLGKTWELVDGPHFPEGEERTVDRYWHVQPGHKSQPGLIWAGVDPGSLFKSEDDGKTWHAVDGINNHPTRENWSEGAGGMMVHTVIQDPVNADRMFVAISAAGVFRSDDGGMSWQPKNKGVLADFLPEHYPEVGQCCHHLVMSPENSDVLYQQNHCGVFRTKDGGDSWTDIGTDRLPSTFGFPMAIHPRDGNTIYVVPLVSSEYRYAPDGRFRVYRSNSGGDSWEGMSSGLPQDNAYLNVFREGLATDSCDPAGVYVGTGSGQLFYSRNEGNSWQAISYTLPPVYSVGTAVIDG
ncbi:MAG TPA: exo-alpha-sialidase [candidate division Zixibacteria bacterium]|nr:exo-alpha-sialidase [candidate division Zixibacteria bacterium]